MKMKTLVKKLEPQGFEVNVYEPRYYKADGYTACRKNFPEKGYAISVIGYNGGGYVISQYAIREVDGEIKVRSQAPLNIMHFDTYKELTSRVFDVINEWTA